MPDIGASSSCAACGYVFQSPEPRVPCPECGGEVRKWEKKFEGSLAFLTSLKAEHKRPGYPGGIIKSIVKRLKRAGESGKLAHETLVYDHSAPDKTTKTHHVEEQQPDGSWKVEHDHSDDYPAKHRPNKAEALTSEDTK